MPSLAHLSERAPEHLGNSLDHVDVGCPLGDALIVADGVEVGMHAEASAIVPTRDNQHGNGVGERLRNTPKGVLGAGAALHAEDPDPGAVVNSAEPVGHIHTGSLLPADDRPNALLGCHVD